jgi:hypothetical protein
VIKKCCPEILLLLRHICYQWMQREGALFIALKSKKIWPSCLNGAWIKTTSLSKVCSTMRWLHSICTDCSHLSTTHHLTANLSLNLLKSHRDRTEMWDSVTTTKQNMPENDSVNCVLNIMLHSHLIWGFLML